MQHNGQLTDRIARVKDKVQRKQLLMVVRSARFNADQTLIDEQNFDQSWDELFDGSLQTLLAYREMPEEKWLGEWFRENGVDW